MTEKFENAISFLFRGFLEVTINNYCNFAGIQQHHQKEPEKQNEKTAVSLIEKMKKCIANLKREGFDDHQLTQALEKTWATSSDMAHTSTFNAYVHNHYMQPNANHLKAAWELYEPFVSKLYEFMAAGRK